jgi:hypothetical protein
MTDLHTATGTIWAVFGHRFAVEGPHGRFLADLGPRGIEGLILSPGETVTVTGERKPSEIKVTRLALGDGSIRAVEWPAKPNHPKPDHAKPDHAPAAPEAALAAARNAGYAPSGEVRRKPKHFEISATKDGAAFALHIALDGALRKVEPAGAKAA